MGAGAMAIIIVLSTFNGFEKLVKNLYSSFQPSIKIEASKGKYFSKNDIDLKSYKYIEATTYTLEENAYFRYGDNECVGTIKGIDEKFSEVTKIDSYVVLGHMRLYDGEYECGVIGAGIDRALNVNVDEGFGQIAVYLPRSDMEQALVPSDAYNTGHLIPTGIFAIQQEFDEKYVLAPLPFVQNISEKSEDIVTSIELKVAPDKVFDVLKLLKKKYPNFKIKDRYEQNEALYKIMKIERWAVFAILGFIIFIISFNILASLSMLVIEKKKDISILKSLGMKDNDIRKIFSTLGVLQASIGAGVGIVVGLIICMIQKEFGIIKLGGSGTFVIDAYPVEIYFTDVVLVFVMIVSISILAALAPARRAKNQEIVF
jgi:lipoprotein-releasing system permease protein